MDSSARPAGTWFMGDLNDPWVASIAAELPPGTRRFSLEGDLPATWPEEPTDATILVAHRPTLTQVDFERLRRERRAGRFATVVLCIGSHARYAQVQRWSDIVEVILPEATASETLRRHIPPLSRRGPSTRRRSEFRPPVRVVAPDHEHALWLAEACRYAGYAPVPARDWRAAPPSDLAVWVVPMLDPRWPSRLEAEAARCRVLTLLAFADRASVRLARSRGAAACLDLPCEPEDLAFVLDRLAGLASSRERASEGTLREPFRDGREATGLLAGPHGRPYNVTGDALSRAQRQHNQEPI